MVTIAVYLRKGTRQIPAGRRLTMGAAITVLLLGLALLSGCQRPQDTPANIVVVASATANEPAPVLAAPDRSMLRNAGSRTTRAAAFVVDPDTGEPREVSLTARRPDGEVDYGPDRNRKLTADVNQVQQLLKTLSASGPFDLLTMLARAIRVTSVPGTLLVLSSGLSTAGGFDLRQVGWGADPHGVAAWLRRRGLLPLLAGWHVVFSGLADTAGRQPALPLPERTTLTRYWLAICQAAGAAACTVDAITRPQPPARSTAPVPIVTFPSVTSFRGPHGQTTNVPADAFFPFDSARLLPGANAVLRPLAVAARRQYLKVTIAGYASPDGGTDAYNLTLSTARARAVKARLIALGVPAGLVTKAVGLGTAGQSRAACYHEAHLDEAICAPLRRVVITLSPAPAAVP